MMPGMDGFEACRLMREMNPELPILFLSAYDAADNRVRGLKLGADDLVIVILFLRSKTSALLLLFVFISYFLQLNNNGHKPGACYQA